MNNFGFVLGIFGLAGTVAIATQVLVEKPSKPQAILASAERPPSLTAQNAAPARPAPQLEIKQSPAPIVEENFSKGLEEAATSVAIKTEAAIPAATDWLIQGDESKPATADNGAAFDPSREVDDLATSSIDKGAIAPAPSTGTAQEKSAPPAIAPEQKSEPRRVEKPKRTEAAPKPRLTRSPAKKTSGHHPTRLAGTRTDESEARAFAQSVTRMQPTGSGFFVSSQFHHGSLGIRGF